VNNVKFRNKKTGAIVVRRCRQNFNSRITLRRLHREAIRAGFERVNK